MPLKQYKSGNSQVVFYKSIEGTFKARRVALGIAFRSYDAPIGYLPFYGVNDFDFSGETSLKEQIMARLPVNLSAAGSPHTMLLQAAAGDVEFLGSGEADLPDIQRLVRLDLTRYAMASASGVLVDGVMLALGGPAIKSLVAQLLQSKVKQFIVSRAISASVKNHLKEKGNLDADKLLRHVR